MRAAAAAFGSLLGACGFGGSSTAVDAASADAAVDGSPPIVIDVAPDATLPAWGSPIGILELASDGNNDDPSLTSDLLTMYFGSTRFGGAGAEDIWMSTRSAIGDPWSTPVAVTELNSIFDESNVDVSADGLTITFSSNRGNTGTFDLYMSQRSPITDVWSIPAPILGLKDSLMESDEYGGQLVDGGLSIFFCSDRGGDTGEVIYFAQRTNLGMPFRDPIPVSGVDSSANECDVWRVDNTLYFTRDGGDATPRDIYAAEKRPAVPLDFLTPQLVGPDVSTTADDSDPWVSPDQRIMFFASDRAAANVASIYMSVR